MKKPVFVLIGSVLAGAMAAERPPEGKEVIPVLIVGSNRFVNAQIIRTTPTDALVKFQGGIARVKLSELPSALQEKYPPNPEGDRPKVPRPQVYQRLPIEVTIRQLETRIAALQKSKSDLVSQETTAENAPADSAVVVDSTRRLIEIDRTLTQLQRQLDRLRAVQTAATRNRNGEPGDPNAPGAPLQNQGAPAQTESGAESDAVNAAPQQPLPRQPATNPERIQPNNGLRQRAGPQRYGYPYRSVVPPNRVPPKTTEPTSSQQP